MRDHKIICAVPKILNSVAGHTIYIKSTYGYITTMKQDIATLKVSSGKANMRHLHLNIPVQQQNRKDPDHRITCTEKLLRFAQLKLQKPKQQIAKHPKPPEKYANTCYTEFTNCLGRLFRPGVLVRRDLDLHRPSNTVTLDRMRDGSRWRTISLVSGAAGQRLRSSVQGARAEGEGLQLQGSYIAAAVLLAGASWK